MNYSNALMEHLKNNEGCVLNPYNNYQTIGYGLDYKTHNDIDINWTNGEDSSITQEEAERLFLLQLNKERDKLNNFLQTENLTLEQGAYDAMIDLFYNRNINSMTKSVARAMAARDDQKVYEFLCINFDYNYASTYLPNIDPTSYVTNNSGLQTRREWEYQLYLNGWG